MIFLLQLAVAAQVQVASPTRPPRAPGVGQPNVAIIVIDDVGVDLLEAYGEGIHTPCTPNIDRLARRGLLFRNAWANPACSPTRAQILTGRHGFRNTIGQIIKSDGSRPGLPLSETTLPELLTGYSSTAAGKWHLGDPSQTIFHPNDQGFDTFSGSFVNLSLAGGDYFQWLKVIAGVVTQVDIYATTDTVDDSLQAVRNMQEPWLLYTAFHSAHVPWHTPPNLDGRNCSNVLPDNASARPPRAKVRQMLEALDVEVGRLLREIERNHPNTYVFFLGDNGSSSAVVFPPFLPEHGKATLYEGGINVPFIVTGPGIQPGESAALVCATDIFATAAELAGVATAAEDSVSMVPYFSGQTTSVRQTVYAELFSPNGLQPYNKHRRAIFDGSYKLIRRIGSLDELFDLRVDPFEQVDLFPGLVVGSEAQMAYDALVAELVTLGVD